MLAFAGMLFACSDNEPSAPSVDDKPDTELMNDIKGLWTGEYYHYRDAARLSYEGLKISFTSADSGLLTITDVNQHGKTYRFAYKTSGNLITCYAKPYSASNDNGETFVLTVEYLNGMLYPRNNEYKKFILGKNTVRVEGDGKIIEDQSELLKKVWLHENGLNVLDFASARPQAFQLNGKGRKDYDVYYRWDAWNDRTYNYIENSIRLMSDTFYGLWTIQELTDNKLVLKSLNGKITDTYYAAKPSEVPQLSNVSEILQSPYSWTSNSLKLYLNPDYTCRFLIQCARVDTPNPNAYSGVVATGTYKVEGGNIEFEFDNVSITDQQGEPMDTYMGFENGKPCKKTCPFTIVNFDEVVIDMPQVRKGTYSAGFNFDLWNVGHN